MSHTYTESVTSTRLFEHQPMSFWQGSGAAEVACGVSALKNLEWLQCYRRKNSNIYVDALQKCKSKEELRSAITHIWYEGNYFVHYSLKSNYSQA